MGTVLLGRQQQVEETMKKVRGQLVREDKGGPVEGQRPAVGELLQDDAAAPTIPSNGVP